MSKKKNAERLNPKKVTKVAEKKPEKSITLAFAGVLLAIISIALLLFVLSEKVFHLS